MSILKANEADLEKLERKKRSVPKLVPVVQELLELVARRFGTEPAMVLGKQKPHSVALARQAFCYLANEELFLSSVQIGEILGLRADSVSRQLIEIRTDVKLGLRFGLAVQELQDSVAAARTAALFYRQKGGTS